MRWLLVLLFATGLSAANYSLQQSYLLDAGVNSITLTDTAGSVQP